MHFALDRMEELVTKKRWIVALASVVAITLIALVFAWVLPALSVL